MAEIYPRFTHESGTIREKPAIDVSKLKRLLCYESQHQSQSNEKSLVQFDYEKAVSNYLCTQSTFNPNLNPMFPVSSGGQRRPHDRRLYRRARPAEDPRVDGGDRRRSDRARDGIRLEASRDKGNTYIYEYICVYMYMYRERERERVDGGDRRRSDRARDGIRLEASRDKGNTYIYLYMYVYICIYI